MFRIARAYSTHSNLEHAIDRWISSPQKLVLSDTFHAERVSDLFITLPTRDGTRKPSQAPTASSPLGYGHHLAFFHNRTPESQLCEEGTDPAFCPPEPFTRRMWVGGKISWNAQSPLLVGGKATASSAVTSVEKKGFGDDQRRPMLFVHQGIEITMVGKDQPSVLEERSHVFVGEGMSTKKAVREVSDIPTTADFSFTYRPTLTTLFRFSALTFNAHRIHLDREFTLKEGYPERLVHGPLTAIMLLETIILHNPRIQMKSFEYRARNPIIVNRPTTIYGAWKGEDTIRLWCLDDDQVVGMTGTVEVV